MRLFLAFIFVASSYCAIAQVTFPNNGTLEKNTVTTAYTNAVIHTDYKTTLSNATLLIKDGRITACGVDVVIPENTRIIDVAGNHIYPSFIEMYSGYGLPKVEKKEWSPKPQTKSNNKGAFGWNEAIKSQNRSSEMFAPQKEAASALLKSGFGIVLTHNKDGIARGTSTLVSLHSNPQKGMLIPDASAHYSFSKGSSRQSYPSSLLGSIALLRQTYYDAKWYSSGLNNQETNLSLERWNEIQGLPQVFEVGDVLDVLRADKIGDEFGVQYLFKTKGDAYQKITAIKNTGGGLITTVNFPKPYDVRDPYNARMVSLEELMHWEQATGNIKRITDAGIEFAISMDGVKDSKQFFENLRKASTWNGSNVSESILKALTYTPAKMVGMENEIGSLKEGMLANFFISKHPFLSKGFEILHHNIQDESHSYKALDPVDLSGTYRLKLKNTEFMIDVVSGKSGYKSKLHQIALNQKDTLMSTPIKISLEGYQIGFICELSAEGVEGIYRFSGNVLMDSKIWEGKCQDSQNNWNDWAAVRQNDEKPEISEVSGQNVLDGAYVLPNVMSPFVAYGWESNPEGKTTLISNATIWTCEEEGILEDAHVLIHNGRIAAVGKKINIEEILGDVPEDLVRIDAKGKHVSPGIIDEHSHIAGRAINEGGQASSAEVSIQTVLDSEDIDMYRQLSGGVTSAQILHGSANPIGGQSAVIKFRWGALPDELLLEGADPFIKFALGENVKQSNWGDYQTERFPQTRMGVEQVYYDYFIAAREYGELWDNYRSKVSLLNRRQIRKGEVPAEPRRDLELEALNEILNSERFVSCHSYRQDEINMLMHVADSMGFTLNTFTHILEGYKVADKMKEHGAGGSSFSDWWAYKFEVKDAIPYNGAILWEQGVVTAFNSDDAEMARRLNQEAAKAVKYGNVPEEEALKFVTLNPAKLLHIDDKVGSVKVGKDADLVIWNDHPLSIYAKCEMTWVDGILYYSDDLDKQKQESIKSERARIIQMMLKEIEGGAESQKPKKKNNNHYHCNTVENENN